MIQIESLTKRYGAHTAVDDVSFTAAPGEVTGFLGPNGAGKSTTLRILTGLAPQDAGTATIGGRRFDELPNPGREVGVLLDASAQHAGRTGREVLGVAAHVMGLPDGRVDETLDVVGLSTAESGRRVRQYSLGMRQRLGLATALLARPAVLVLDEPANGLDPAGIRWMRDLLRSYADDGATVLLSSHLLHEIEQVADRIVVIGGGRVVGSGTTASLLATSGSIARTTDPAPLEGALDAAGLQHRDRDGLLHVDAEPGEVAAVAHRAGVLLTELRPAGGTGLEETFLRLTAETAREGVTTDGGDR